MSSWDRQDAINKYRARFAACADEEALIEELGTPTKLAIDLAASYVPTRSPSMLAAALTRCPVELEDMLRDPGVLAADLSVPDEPDDAPKPETWVFEPAPAPAEEPAPAPEPAPEPEAAPEEKELPPAGKRVRSGALAAFLVPAILIGLPIAVLLVCLGLPFLCGGGALIFSAIYEGMQVFPSLTLVSDMLLVGGAMLLACGVGLLLAWFGLWLSMELCWLWVGKALTGLGKRLCVREEAA